MEMLRRRLYTPIFHIDTNLINARGKLDEMNQIEKWAEDDVILVNMSEVSFSEAQQGNNAARTKKTLNHIFTLIENQLDESDQTYKNVASILFPDGIKNENQSNDVKIICHASHYQAILISNDGGSKSQPGGILGNANALRDVATIMSPAEAVSFIQNKIKARDDHNHQVSEHTGNPMPEWSGCD